MRAKPAATRMSGPAGSPFPKTAGEVADQKPPAGPLQAAQQGGDADALASRRGAAGDGQVLVRIDGEAARLHLVDAAARDQLAQLLHLALLVRHAGEREQVERRVHAAPLRETDGLVDVLPAVPDRLVVCLVERLVRAIQAD